MEDWLPEFQMPEMRLTRFQKKLRSMKISKTKIFDTIAIFAIGKGEYSEIRFQFVSYDRGISESLELEEAKELLKVLKEAIADCERRKLLKDEE